MRDARRGGGERLLHLGANPGIMRRLLLRGGEFRDDGRELCHEGNITVRGWRGKARAVGCVRNGEGRFAPDWLDDFAGTKPRTRTGQLAGLENGRVLFLALGTRSVTVPGKATELVTPH